MRSFWIVMVLLAFAAVALFWSGPLARRGEAEPRSMTTGVFNPTTMS